MCLEVILFTRDMYVLSIVYHKTHKYIWSLEFFYTIFGVLLNFLKTKDILIFLKTKMGINFFF